MNEMRNSEPIKFKGIVLYERFYSEETYWGVYNVKTFENLPHSDEVDRPGLFEDSKDFEPYHLVAVAGKMQQLYIGSEYEFTAKCEFNTKYKTWNYVPDTIVAVAPTSLKESQLFLSSILTERQADVLLKEYPNIIQEIIEGRDNVDVKKLYGIGNKIYAGIREKILNNYVISDIITLLQPYGITFTAIKNLLKWEPNSSILKQKIKDNPYVLTEARGFGFQTVDRIALKLQPELVDSGKRLIAFMKYVLNKAAEEEGHTWVEFIELSNSIIDQIPQCKDLFDTLVAQNEGGLFAGIFYIKDSKIGLKKYKDCEEAIYYILKNLDQYQFNCKMDTERGIKKAEKDLGYELTEDQKAIVEQVKKNNIILFTGPAGTGKSSSARAILNSFTNASIACCSLSAKAAQRIQEATGFKAMTIHRLLGFSPSGFTYTAKNRLEHDVIFVDEASMINCMLFYYLLSAVKEGAKVIICGDAAQLPPIGAGNIFSDLLHMNNDFNISILTKVHRQAEKSGILTDVNKIREGIYPIEKPELQIINGELKDMVYIFRDNRERMQSIVIKQFVKIVDKYGINSVAVAVPRKDTVTNSALEINKQIQLQLIDTEFTPFIQGIQNRFYIGDRILQTENDGVRNIYNGEIGFVEQVFPNAKKTDTCMVARFKSTLREDDKIIEYTREQLASVVLGYAMSIHKMQGSEYDYVLVVIDNTHYALLDKCLLYTGITRAKKMCILVAEPEAFNRAMKTNHVMSRQTWLKLKTEEGAM